MKKLIAACVVSSVVVLAGCASPMPVGGFYNGVKYPVQVTEASGASKTGTATCKSILSLFAFGDCSIEAAKANGNITKVSSSDWQSTNVLGLFGTYTLILKGE